MPTFASIRSTCSKRFLDANHAIVGDLSTGSLPGWDEYVNEAYRDILTSSPWWPFREAQQANITITAGVALLPAEVWQVLAVWDQTDEYPLTPLEGRTQYLLMYPQQDVEGTPWQYRIFNNQIFVYPANSGPLELRLDYLAVIPDLANDGDVPVFPHTYHHLLVDGAMMRAYEDDGNSQQAQTASAHFLSGIKAMMNDLLTGRQERYPEIVDNFI